MSKRQIDKLLNRLKELMKLIDEFGVRDDLNESQKAAIMLIRDKAAHLAQIPLGWHQIAREMSLTQLKLIIHNFIIKTWKRWFS